MTVTLTRGEVAAMLAKLDEFLRRHPDYPARGLEPSLCVDCLELGIGRWRCTCRMDD